MMSELDSAWKSREQSGAFSLSEAVRVFHGPGEGTGALRDLAIDRFGDHYWVTEWSQNSASPNSLDEIRRFLMSKSAKSAVHLLRPERGLPADPAILFGESPEGRFPVSEGKMKFYVQLLGVKHPGLFLDHAPLRQWLLENSKGLRVLNTFAYTGSLSVAAGLGRASGVTTLDLSKATIEWAKENWKLNRLKEEGGDFIYGDFFEWLPRLSKKKARFDCVILDPPSFSRGKKGNFSTAKDLKRLHDLALDVLAPGGILATSINSANVTRKKFFFDIQDAAKEKGRRIEIIREVDLPRTFPSRNSSEADRYLKGWILRCA